MSIPKALDKSKEWLLNIPKDILFLLISVLAASASFGLGMITEHEMGKRENLPFESFSDKNTLPANAISAVETPKTQTPAATKNIETAANVAPQDGKYVASKNGTRYYLPSCSSAARIKAENRVWFATTLEAEAAGLTPATNCPGL